MEEIKNNALDKAENIAGNGESKEKRKSVSQKPKAKKAAKSEKKIVKSKSAKKDKKAEKNKIRAQKREEKRRAKELKKAEREKVRAEKRVELARIKAHKKAEKEKAKAAALREKNRKKAEIKEKKLILAEQKRERKEMLKNETKKERMKRISEEKAQKAEEKRQKREAKAELKKQKLAAKRAAKEQRRKDRQRNKERRRGFGGWLAAVISLGVATLVLASVLTFTFLMPAPSDNLLEMNYSKSFFDTVKQVDNIDLNLSKALATADDGAMQTYLVNAAINSELAENDLQQLPIRDESKYYTTKLINQIGDFSKYLNNKIVAGEKLSAEDRQNLQRLYKANATFKDALQNMLEKMGEDFSFSSIKDGGENNLVIGGFDELQNISAGYPELIYDGPFSDGKANREVKGISGEKLSDKEARDAFIGIFSSYALDDVKNVGMTDGDIECYNVQGVKDGEILFAQISATGGKLVMFSYAGSCEKVEHGETFAVAKAEEFIQSLGIDGMKPVWINLADNVYTINFAYTLDGAIIYPDLIKIRVCAETAMVIGMEATSYYTNHTERTIDKPLLDERQAMTKVSEDIEIMTSRLAVVPVGRSSEKLCYEFSGEFEGNTFYVYIDAMTGRQVEMFKVVKSTEGALLM